MKSASDGFLVPSLLGTAPCSSLWKLQWPEADVEKHGIRNALLCTKITRLVIIMGYRVGAFRLAWRFLYIPNRRPQIREPRLGDDHHVGVLQQAGVHHAGLVGGAVAELHGRQPVGAPAEYEFGFRRLQAIRLKIHLRIVAYKIHDIPVPEIDERFCDARLIGALGGWWLADLPDFIGSLLESELAWAGFNLDVIHLQLI